MQDLKNHLKAKPNLKTVYFNDKNEWSFVKHPRFPKEVSREDVLKMEDEAPAATDEASAEQIATLQNQVAAMDAELNKRQEEINSKDKEIVGLKEKVAAMDAELKELKKKNK